MLRWIAENDEEAQAPAAAPPPERVSSGEESDAIKNLRVEAARLQAENHRYSTAQRAYHADFVFRVRIAGLQLAHRGSIIFLIAANLHARALRPLLPRIELPRDPSGGQ